MSETVIEFIMLSGQKIRSRILLFRVGSGTCWVRKVRFAKLKGESVVEYLGLRLDQFISGTLKSPSIIMVGRGEGSNMTFVLIFKNISSNQSQLQSRKGDGKQG